MPPEFDDADAYLDFALAEVLPEAAKLAEAADVFLERGAFDAEQARRYLTACRDAGLALRLHGDQFTEQGAIPLAVELGARSVDHLEATGRGGIAALAASEVVGVLLPASALFLGRSMPPARALVDAGAAVALATDFNPGSAFCESLPLVCSLAATQLKLSPAEALGRGDRERRPCARPCGAQGADRARLRRRPRPARRARLAVPRLPPRPRPCRPGDRGRRANLAPMPTRKQRRRQAKDRRHEYEYVYVDDQGQEVEVDDDEPESRAAKSAPAKAGVRPNAKSPKPAGKAAAASSPWDARSSRRRGTESSAAA